MRAAGSFRTDASSERISVFQLIEFVEPNVDRALGTVQDFSDIADAAVRQHRGERGSKPPPVLLIKRIVDALHTASVLRRVVKFLG